MLEFFIDIHTDAKTLLKRLAFSEKSETNLPLTLFCFPFLNFFIVYSKSFVRFCRNL